MSVKMRIHMPITIPCAQITMLTNQSNVKQQILANLYTYIKKRAELLSVERTPDRAHEITTFIVFQNTRYLVNGLIRKNITGPNSSDCYKETSDEIRLFS